MVPKDNCCYQAVYSQIPAQGPLRPSPATPALPEANRQLEDQTRIEHEGMVVQMKASGGDLLSNAQNQPEPALGIAAQLEWANHEAGADEVLHAPVIRASVEKCGVVLNLRPELLVDAILPHHVPCNHPPDAMGVCCG